MMRDDAVYLRHILDAFARIEEYLQGIDEHGFYHHPLIQDGDIRQLEIIGEAAKHLSVQLRKKYSHIPWQDIAGTRDKLIHAYFGVDLGKVWLMAKDDLPILKTEIAKIIDQSKR